MKIKICFFVIMLFLVLNICGCTQKLSLNEQIIENDVSSIIIKEKYGDINIESTSNNNSYIEYKEDGSKYSLSIAYDASTKTLDIFRKDTRSSFEKRSEIKNCFITLYLKEEDYEKITIESLNCDVSVEDLSCDSLTISLTNGDIELEDVNVKEETSLKSNKGDFEIESSSINSLSIESTYSGELDIDNLKVDKEINIKGQTLEVETNNLSTNNLVVEIMNGNTTFKKTTISKLGDVNITTGSIKLNLNSSKSNYTIKAKTSTGTPNVQSGNGSIVITLTTSVGDVSVTYNK